MMYATMLKELSAKSKVTLTTAMMSARDEYEHGFELQVR